MSLGNIVLGQPSRKDEQRHRNSDIQGRSGAKIICHTLGLWSESLKQGSCLVAGDFEIRVLDVLTAHIYRDEAPKFLKYL